MSKSAWVWFGAPAAVYLAYMCWLSGFEAGYDRGQGDAWTTARASFMDRGRQFALRDDLSAAATAP